jgi:hypothetical protein
VKRIFLIFVFTLISSVVFVECTNVQERTQTLESEHPEWGEETIRSIAARDVEPGMTTDMVLAALGKRREVKYEPGPREEVWIYHQGIWVHDGYEGYPAWIPIYWVYFKDGKVVRTEGDKNDIPPW